MADPTLINNVTPYTGFTLQQITERLLASRGMTLDSTTMRTVAITSEETDAYTRIRRAFTLASAKYPGLFFVQEYSVAWTAGNTMIYLPANVQNILYVNYKGRPCRELTRKMRANILDGLNTSNEQQFKISGDIVYWHARGLTDIGAANAPEYRVVLELLPHPASTDTEIVTIGYNAKAPALPSSASNQKDDVLPANEPLQEWILRRAQELWAADEGDATTREIAISERQVIEMDLDEIVEANLGVPSVILPEYPTAPDYQRRR